MCSLNITRCAVPDAQCLPDPGTEHPYRELMAAQPMHPHATCGDWRLVAARGEWWLDVAARGDGGDELASRPRNRCTEALAITSEIQAQNARHEPCSVSAPHHEYDDA